MRVGVTQIRFIGEGSFFRTWNGYILDGHTRYRILKKHGFIKFEVEEIQLANESP
mgnify:FL=1